MHRYFTNYNVDESGFHFFSFSSFGDSGITGMSVNDPAWKWKVDHGVNATHNHTRTYRDFKPVASIVFWDKPDGTQHARGAHAPFWEPVLANFPYSLIEANTNAFNDRVRKKYNALGREFEGGVFVGELKETLLMLRHPLQGMTKLTKSYFTSASSIKSRFTRSNRKAERRSLVHALNDTYLEYTYGMAPLMNDVQSIHSLLSSSIGAPGINKERVSVYSEMKQSSPWTYYRTIGCGIGPTNLYWWGSAEFTHSIRARAYYDLSDRGILSTLGFDLSSFVPTMWELLPWSFVIDYVSNLGEVVSALGAPQRKLRYGFTVVKQNYTTYSQIRDYRNDGIRLPEGYRVVPGTTKASLDYYVRTPFVLPDVKFHLKLPGLWQDLNMLSLSLGLFKSR